MLPSGQSFRWTAGRVVQWRRQEGTLYYEWTGLLTDSIVVLRKPEAAHNRGEPDVVHYQLTGEKHGIGLDLQLRDYLRAEIDLLLHSSTIELRTGCSERRLRVSVVCALCASRP
eukprot:IDg6571t1